jgi:hypothetical protein
MKEQFSFHGNSALPLSKGHKQSQNSSVRPCFCKCASSREKFAEVNPEKLHISLLRARIQVKMNLLPNYFPRNKGHWNRDDCIFSFLGWVRLGPRRRLFLPLYEARMIDDDDDCGAVGGMGIGRGDRSTWRKPALASFCPPQIPYDLTWDRTRAPSVRSRRLGA